MPDPQGILDGFLFQTRRQPHAPALVWRDVETTYRELLDVARRYQRDLARLSLVDGEVIGVVAAKSPDTVALVLACMLTERPFLLPSPNLSEPLLHDLFTRAGCRHVVTAEQGMLRSTSQGEAEHRPAPRATSFMFTTSGSTGPPKIVPLGRDGTDRFSAWAGASFGIGPGTTVLSYAPMNFDLSLLDIWTTLARGGRVVLVDPDRAGNGRYLLHLVTRHEVHVMQGVPTFYGLLLDAVPETAPALSSVRHAVFTGDVVPEPVLARLPELFPLARLHNVYGCTETNDSFRYEIPAGFPPDGPVPIGEPLPGVDALVLGADGRVVEGPGSGELYVSTPFQAAGYLDPDRDPGRFTGHPSELGGGPWFRTGDLVWRDERHRMHITGRDDFQVKIRGVAVNTAEVETVLLAHPEVREAAATTVSGSLAGRALVAVVRRAPGSSLNTLRLREHCARRLSPAAIPSTLRITDNPLQKTATGKIDRNALVENGSSAIKGRAS